MDRSAQVLLETCREDITEHMSRIRKLFAPEMCFEYKLRTSDCIGVPCVSEQLRLSDRVGVKEAYFKDA